MFRRGLFLDELPGQAFAIQYSNTKSEKMAEHIEDLQQRYADLRKRIELVRSYL